jgi:hypothetical protein
MQLVLDPFQEGHLGRYPNAKPLTSLPRKIEKIDGNAPIILIYKP